MPCSGVSTGGLIAGGVGLQLVCVCALLCCCAKVAPRLLFHTLIPRMRFELSGVLTGRRHRAARRYCSSPRTSRRRHQVHVRAATALQLQGLRILALLGTQELEIAFCKGT